MTEIGQTGKPNGLLGRLLGRTMNWYNHLDNKKTIELMNISPSDVILEVGYGTGQAIHYGSTRIEDGKIYGMDHSDTMYNVASKRNRKSIEKDTTVRDGKRDVYDPFKKENIMDWIRQANFQNTQVHEQSDKKHKIVVITGTKTSDES